MKQYEFKSLEDLFECYDREDLIAIDTLKQAMFYVMQGVQPEFVWQKEDEPNRMTFWFLKKKTQYVFKEWQKTKKTENKIRFRKVEDDECGE